MRYRRRRRGLLGGRSGTAVMEMGLIAPVLMLLVSLMLDFTRAFTFKLALVNATSLAAQYAFINGMGLTATTIPAFITTATTIVTEAASLSITPQVQVRYNNATDGSLAGNYYCVSGSAPNLTWTSTGTSSASCGGTTMSGKFISIAITARLVPMFVTDTVVTSVFNLSDFAIVRVQ